MNTVDFGINSYSSNFSPHKNSFLPKGEDIDDIAYLLDNVPELDSLFVLKKKIGYGTFSSVYLGHAKSKSTSTNKKYYAIKHIIPTSHPSRIFMELKCLKLMGGKDNIIEATLCLRNLNHIVFIMPYFNHDVFSDYVGKLTIQEICDYIYNLLKALEKVHSYNIVHRDIKPSNFLYSRKHRRYALIDFGLAQDLNNDQNENGVCTNVEKKFISPANESGIRSVKRKLSTTYNSTTITPMNLELEGSSIKNVRLSSAAYDPHNLTSNHIPKSSTITPVNLELGGSSNKKIRLSSAASDPHNLTSNGIPKDSPSKHTRLALSVRSEKNCSRTENSKFNKGGELPVQCKRNLALQANILRRSPRKLENANRIKFLKGFSSKATSSGSWTKSFENSAGASISGYSCSGNFNSDAINNNNNNTNNNNKISTLQEVKTKSGRTILCPTSCRCYGSAKICSICLGRKSQHAPRAGTPGFRAPEVLLRHPSQTTALDIWSAGVVLLCLASSRCSFFRPVDDISSLAEITTVFGTKVMKKIAANLEKLFTCSEDVPPLNLRLICEKLRANSSAQDTNIQKLNEDCCQGCKQSISECICLVNKNFQVEKNSDLSKTFNDSKSMSSESVHDAASGTKNAVPLPMSLYDLLYKLLDPNLSTRITAKKALSHPFFEECLKSD